MLSLMVIMLAAAAEPPAPGTAQERITYIITTPDGKLPVFWDEAAFQSEADWVRVEVDEPWAPRIWQGKKSLVTVEGRERKNTRDDRIKKGYEEHGYVEVNGRFISTAEVEYAERARKLAEAAAPAASSSTEPTAAPGSVSPSSPEISPPAAAPASLFKRYGPHAGIAAVAAILLAVVAKTLLA